ncbi:RsmB/NOP family class I SAM-dependent RNA methyltransferase [Magnetospirillum sulfuroxidans]|uniref:MFS transporter n=1 Tax=Magnetospirillum sulfuroxidans TaxID=611300 RepID=A0ABS5IIR4_9PROT|nr:transcription antitermination factor NusB [Magnetospirillum sulfuroxidans]MBR9973658.1 MFS transporter [Magnetospirillum sulfuroxidans]
MARTPPLDPRSIVLDLLDSVLAQKRLLDESLDSEPRLSKLADRDRAFVRLLVATILRRLGQIDQVIGRCLERDLPVKAIRVRNMLRLGAAQLLFLDTPPHAAISTTVDLAKNSQLAGFAKLINAVLRRLDREGRAWVAEQDAAPLNTPSWLWQSWRATYGEDLARHIAAAHQVEAPVDITVAGDPTLWAERLEAEILPTGTLRRHGGGDVTQLPGFAEGAWWVQDLAASLPAKLMGSLKGKQVADLCAAPGGKALQLAVAGAEVTAVDRSAKRMLRFRRNLERLKLAATIVETDVAGWIPPALFDAVLLDAPCTATGTLRRHPDGVHLKGPGDVAYLADQQHALLKAAVSMVKPGGTLVYCVCSLEPQEGEAQITRLLDSGASICRDPILATEVPGLEMILTPAGEVRTLPHYLAEKGGMDAFFIARLKRLE